MTKMLDDIFASATRMVRGEYTSLLLFGSYARGDPGAESDVDILQVVPSHRASYRVGPFAFSAYTARHLFRMAEHGSLFALHLVREALEISDPGHILSALRAKFVYPKDCKKLRVELGRALRLLDVDEHGYILRWQKYEMLAVYILRSALYSYAYDSGRLSFSLDKVISVLGRSELGPLVRAAGVGGPNFVRFGQLAKNCGDLLGVDVVNPCKSADALIVDSWNQSPLTIILGLRLLRRDERLLSYEEFDLSEGAIDG